MASGHPFELPVATLRGRTGVQHHHHIESVFEPVAISTARVVDDPITIEVVLEAVPAGIMATGTIRARWTGECRRCLQPVTGPLEIEFKELFEAHPDPGESYLLGSEVVDLEPMVRELLSLELPLAPLCDNQCQGPAPEWFGGVEGDEAPAPHRPDPRWAPLDSLDFD